MTFTSEPFADSWLPDAEDSGHSRLAAQRFDRALHWGGHSPMIGIADSESKRIAYQRHCLLESGMADHQQMLIGAPLGEALKKAIERKEVSQRQVADEFKIKQPSVAEWCKYGRISKRHIPHLVAYFADVVGPEHWGLPKNWAMGKRPPPDPSSGFADPPSDEDTDWGKLQGDWPYLPPNIKKQILDLATPHADSNREHLQRMLKEQQEKAKRKKPGGKPSAEEK